MLCWSLWKVSALASFPLTSSSPRLSLLHVALFHSLHKTVTLRQVLNGKMEFESCRFWQKPPGLTSVLSSSCPLLPQILARSKKHPTRQMSPLNSGTPAKPSRKGLQMKSKLSCLLPLANSKKKYQTQTKTSKTTENARMWSFGNNSLFVIPTNKICLCCSYIQEHACRSWNSHSKMVIPHSKDFIGLVLWA